MTRFLALAALSTSVAGCIGSTPTPNALASGTGTGFWTSRPADEVQACITRVTGTSEATPRPRFDVRSTTPTEGGYVTTVSIFTETPADPVIDNVLINCGLSGLDQRSTPAAN